MVRGPRSRHWAPLHAGRAQQSAQGWAGPWPAGRRGGVDRGGGAPHPLSRFPPQRRPITRQAPAPGAASSGPATPKRQVFAGKKSERLAARRAVVVVRALRIVHNSARGPGHTRDSFAISRRASAQASKWIREAREVSGQADLGASLGRGAGVGMCVGGKGPGGLTLQNFPERPRTLAQHRCTRSPRQGCPTRGFGVFPPPCRPLGVVPGSPGSGRGERNIPGAQRWSRRLGGGGPGEPRGRMSGSAPARGAPRDSIVAPEPDFARP